MQQEVEIGWVWSQQALVPRHNRRDAVTTGQSGMIYWRPSSCGETLPATYPD